MGAGLTQDTQVCPHPEASSCAMPTPILRTLASLVSCSVSCEGPGSQQVPSLLPPLYRHQAHSLKQNQDKGTKEQENG